MSIWIGKQFDGKDFADAELCIDWNKDANDIGFSEVKFFDDGDGGIYIIGICTDIFDYAETSGSKLPAPIQFHLHTKPYKVGFKEKQKEVQPSKCESVFIKLLKDGGYVEGSSSSSNSSGKAYSGNLKFDKNEMLLDMFADKPELALVLTETTEDKLKDKKPMISTGGGRKSYSENSKQKIENKLNFILTEAGKLTGEDPAKSLTEATVNISTLEGDSREIYLKLLGLITQ